VTVSYETCLYHADKMNGEEIRNMNEWNRIWGNRSSDIVISDNIFDMFCKLKKADGFDTQDVDGYYEAFFHNGNIWWNTLHRMLAIFQVCMKWDVEAV
jgi:hypothetical protein